MARFHRLEDMTNALINGNAAATTALFAMGGILATSNKYIEQVFRLSQTYPRELTGGFVVGFASPFLFGPFCSHKSEESLLDLFFTCVPPFLPSLFHFLIPKCDLLPG